MTTINICIRLFSPAHGSGLCPLNSFGLMGEEVEVVAETTLREHDCCCSESKKSYCLKTDRHNYRPTSNISRARLYLGLYWWPGPPLPLRRTCTVCRVEFPKLFFWGSMGRWRLELRWPRWWVLAVVSFSNTQSMVASQMNQADKPANIFYLSADCNCVRGSNLHALLHGCGTKSRVTDRI